MNPVEDLFDDEESKLRKSLEKSLWGAKIGMPGGRLLFTREEVAAVLRTKPETIDKMVAKGRLDAVVLDEDEPPLFRPEAILSLLDSSSRAAQKSGREMVEYRNRMDRERSGSES